jgi:hypothetical protein
MATGVTLIVVGVYKFVEGAWIIVILIPVLIFGFCKVYNHYQEVDKQLSLGEPPRQLTEPFPTRVVVPVAGVNRGMVDAINYARAISKNVTAVYVELESGAGEHVRRDWERRWPDVPLVILPSPYRSIVAPFMEFLDRIDEQYNDGQLAAVVLPEWIPAKWWQSLLHNQTARLIRSALLYHRRDLGFQRVIIDVPYHLRR